MRILVTGASGFIGSQLALYARLQQHDVVATGLARTPAESLRIRELAKHGIHVEQCDLHDDKGVAKLLVGCDAVIHLAAAQHEAGVPDWYFFDLNVDVTNRLLKACVAAGVQRFVYASTIGVYGDASRERRLSEASLLNPQNAYARSKVVAEQQVRQFNGQLASVIVRISEAYGPGDFRLLKLFRTVARGVFVKIGAGKNKRQPIHVRDLARGLLLAAQHPKAPGETFVFAGPEELTTSEATNIIANALRVRVRHWRLPMKPMLFAARATASVCRQFGIEPPLHPRRLDFFVKSFAFDASKAKRVLGFEPSIGFADGVRDTVNWYTEHELLHGPTKTVDLNKVPAPVVDVPLAANPERPWQYSEILEFTHDAIIIWEMDGRGIVYWNRAAELLYGYDRLEALGQVTHKLLKTSVDGNVTKLEAQLQRLGVWSGELKHVTKAGREVIVQARLALMAQEDGKWLVLEVNRDLTTELPKTAFRLLHTTRDEEVTQH